MSDSQVAELEIYGSCDEQFAAVRDAFAANFEEGGELGASFAATVNGESVVDLWAGHADPERTQPWERDTIVNVWSTTKAMTAICAHMLVDRGLLDVDAPVAKYWPEFAQAGKGDLPVRYIMSHRAGLPHIAKPMLPTEALYDWDTMTSALAAHEPQWEPGTKHGYHSITFGYLVGEVIKRITGRSVGAFFRDEVANPLGADFYIGLPKEHHSRAATLLPPPPSNAPGGQAVAGNPPMTADTANTASWRSAEIPAANGHGNARSAARVMSALALGGEVDGVRLMSQSTIEKAIEEQAFGPDLTLTVKMRWGLGFMLPHEGQKFGPNPRAFGHGGWGGSLAIADLDAGVSWAYVMNKMLMTTTGDSRASRIANALYASL